MYNFYFNFERYRSKYNKKEKVFCYNIDSMEFEQENKILQIKGWGFSKENLKKLGFMIPSSEGEATSFKRIDREDVNDAYNISKMEQLGFEIAVAVSKEPKQLKLILKDIGGITLPVKIEKSKIGKVDTLRFLKNSAVLLKNEGAMEAINRIKIQGKKIWNDYDYWIYQNERYSVETIEKEIESFQIQPKISIVVPVYNVAEKWLRKNIESILEQFYKNWELCLADDCSPSPHVRRVLEEYAEKDSRIKIVFREQNGHISEATNSAIDISTGAYIGFMDNDDELSPAALYEYVKLLNEKPSAEFIYCDEDMVDTTGRRFNPFFKSNWNPKLLLGHNYITHFVVVKRELLDKVGKLNSEVNGSQDYDFVLRATEATDEIHHIPKILYHWRTIEGSVAENPEAKNYAYISGQRALENALDRRKIAGEVSIGKSYGTYKIEYQYPEEVFVSIIMVHQSENQSIEAECLNKLLANTKYGAYEVIAVNYNMETINDNEKHVHFIYNNANRTFNQLRNYAAQKAKGEFLVFLDSTVLPQNSLWLNELVNEGRNPKTGLVGGKLLDKNSLILNSGMWFENDFTNVHYTHRGCTSDNIGYYYRLVLPQNVFAVSDEIVFISKAVFEAIDGFSQEFQFPLSSIDFCLKTRKLGKDLVWTPYTIMQQLENRKEFVEKENFERFLVEWSPETCADPYTNPYIIEKKI